MRSPSGALASASLAAAARGVAVDLEQAFGRVVPVAMRGRVSKAVGLVIEATGIQAHVGELCELVTPGEPPLLAEVVGFQHNTAILTPLGATSGLSALTEVLPTGRGHACPVGPALLGFLSAVLPAIAMGNTVVAVPSFPAPLPATDLYQVLDTSDLPAGVVNIVTGLPAELAPVLAAHDDVDGVWYFGTAEGGAEVERLSSGNMKRTWVDHGRERDWTDPREGEGEEFLEQATQVKNI